MSFGEGGGITLPALCDFGEIGIPDFGNSGAFFTAVSVVAFCFIVPGSIVVVFEDSRPVTPFKLLGGTTVVDEVIETEESLDVILECIPFDTPFETGLLGSAWLSETDRTLIVLRNRGSPEARLPYLSLLVVDTVVLDREGLGEGIPETDIGRGFDFISRAVSFTVG